MSNRVACGITLSNKGKTLWGNLKKNTKSMKVLWENTTEHQSS